MRKKLLLTLLLFSSLFLGIPTYAQEPEEEEIEFSIDDTPSSPGYPKTPVLMPHLWQNGYLG